jgi:DHA1 family inner membrane transport protein
VIAIVVSGVLSFSLTTPQQHAILAIAPDAGTLVTSLYQSAVYLAISASGVVGAIGLNLLGPALIAPLAAVVVLASAVPGRRSSGAVSHRGQPHRPSGVRSS